MTWKYKAVVLEAGLVNWKWKDDSLTGMSIEEGLNRLGRDGWELVTATPYVMAGLTGEITFIFKQAG